MSSEEFMIWAKLVDVDPWDEHADLGFGVVASMVANMSGKVLSSEAPRVSPHDVMPLPVPVTSEPDPAKFFGAL